MGTNLKDLQLQLADTYVDEDDAMDLYTRIEEQADFKISDLQGRSLMSVDYFYIQEISEQIQRIIDLRNDLQHPCLIRMRDAWRQRAIIQQQIWDTEDGIL